MWPWNKTKAQPVKFATPLGDFILEDSQAAGAVWESTFNVRGEDITVSVKDVQGQPNPAFLASVPNIIRDLPELEKVARLTVPKISERHQFSSIEDAAVEPSDADFILGFNYEEEAWGETVYIYFQNGGVSGWCSAD